MGDILVYRDELLKSMSFLADQTNTIFMGQSVKYPGNAIYKTLEDAKVPTERRIEFPVFEDQQMGIAIGMCLEGYVPISIFPRMDFLILAMNQLVNHLDKMSTITFGEFCPKVIIRVAVGSSAPMFPGVQHCSDYTEGLRVILKNVEVIKLSKPIEIFPAYQRAYLRNDGKSTLLIEIPDLFASTQET